MHLKLQMCLNVHWIQVSSFVYDFFTGGREREKAQHMSLRTFLESVYCSLRYAQHTECKERAHKSEGNIEYNTKMLIM